MFTCASITTPRISKPIHHRCQDGRDCRCLLAIRPMPMMQGRTTRYQEDDAIMPDAAHGHARRRWCRQRCFFRRRRPLLARFSFYYATSFILESPATGLHYFANERCMGYARAVTTTQADYIIPIFLADARCCCCRRRLLTGAFRRSSSLPASGRYRRKSRATQRLTADLATSYRRLRRLHVAAARRKLSFTAAQS